MSSCCLLGGGPQPPTPRAFSNPSNRQAKQREESSGDRSARAPEAAAGEPQDGGQLWTRRESCSASAGSRSPRRRRRATFASAPSPSPPTPLPVSQPSCPLRPRKPLFPHSRLIVHVHALVFKPSGYCLSYSESGGADASRV